jgi:hypothetical protein
MRGAMDKLNLKRTVVCAGLLLGAASVAGAQGRGLTVPTIGITGAWGTRQGMAKQYDAVHELVAGAAEGVRRAADALTGGPASGPEELRGLREGTTVLVRYSSDSVLQPGQRAAAMEDSSVTLTEGMVTRVKPGRGEVEIQLNGRTERLRLGNYADSKEPAGTGAETVVVYFPDENGQRVAHYFTRVS